MGVDGGRSVYRHGRELQFTGKSDVLLAMTFREVLAASSVR